VDFVSIICILVVVLVSFGALALITLFLSCDLAAEQEKKQALKDKQNR
jgi:hypothetical protein